MEMCVKLYKTQRENSLCAHAIGQGDGLKSVSLQNMCPPAHRGEEGMVQASD